MPTDWMSPCGVGYRQWEDGRFEVEGHGFPVWEAPIYQEQIAKMWQRWGSAIEASAMKNQIPASWIVGLMYIESKGEPYVCSSAGACGLMQFMPGTCRMYGHECSWYNDNLGQQIIDAGHLLSVVKLKERGGSCILCAVKAYNGGSNCGITEKYGAGPGILNMWGENNYVEKFVRTANTFVAMNLPSATGIMGGGSVSATTQVIVVAGILGAVAYMFADIHYGLTNRALDAYARRFA